LETKKINEGWLECKTLGCNGKPQITDDTTGEIICGSCGSILAERSVDINSEKAGDFEEFLAKSRTGPEQSLSMYDMGMMTVISDKDAMGKHLSDSMKNTFGRLKRLNSRSRTRSSNRTLRFALLFLHSLKTKLGLPDSVAENAAYIYRKAMQKKITVGRNSKILMCASVYVSCRQSGIPRSIIDVSQAAFVTKKQVSRACRILIEVLDLNLGFCEPLEFVAKIANEAKITQQTSRNALKLLHKLSEEGLTNGKNPVVLAAATLYLSCLLNGEHKLQSEIAKASGATATALRIRCTALKKDLGLTDDLSY
ncbi:MAG: transcription initiation factor IIB, partial [Nitrosopumilaceae archaeon]